MSTDTGHDGVHDPSRQPTVPTDETPEERAARLGQRESDTEHEEKTAKKRKGRDDGQTEREAS